MHSMKVITVAGAPSTGKTAIISHLVQGYAAQGIQTAAVKFDALVTHDDALYREKLKIPALKGLSDYVCPDHYYVSNLEEVWSWGREQKADILFIETAGLCYRCAPHVQDVPAITVVDNLGGIDTPEKMGPILSLADAVVVTKSDMVSQAEREVFIYKIKAVNPGATVFQINGLTGAGSLLLKRLMDEWPSTDEIAHKNLRYSMPAAICSYCTGEIRIGQQFQSGNVNKINM